MKNVLTTLAKNIPLELTATALAADPDIQKGSQCANDSIYKFN